MDYEQKYKEALERARELKNKLEKSCSFATPTGIETIFPELKESEDEKIRKELIRLLNVMTDGIIENYTPIPLRDLVAWLEKQGKRNSADSYCQENCKGFQESGKCFADGECKAKREAEQNNIVERLTAFAQHLQKRGAFRDDLFMDFEHEAQSFIEMLNNKEL